MLRVTLLGSIAICHDSGMDFKIISETPRTLKLLLNIESYEYSHLADNYGPGLRVITHPAKEHPSHLSKGVMVPPGITAFIRVSPTRVRYTHLQAYIYNYMRILITINTKV